MIKPQVYRYIEDVQSGKILACKYVKQAIQRHLDDLEHGSERGLYFDEDDAEFVGTFVSLLKHSKGRWAGHSFELADWQAFIVWVLFGWKRADGTRRFRTAYNEVARKNGKSTFVAALGLYALALDGEAGAQVYSVATKEEQARITFNEGKNMTKSANYLDGLARVHKLAITIPSNDSLWKPLGSDKNTLDGLNPSFTIIDEYHAHKDRHLLDVMDSAMGARSQPLIFIITTAGFNTGCACHVEHDYAARVLSGEVKNDDYFAIIYTLDTNSNGEIEDDWKDPEVWIKANPNFDVSVYRDDMQRMATKAADDPTARNNFLVKRLNIWTTQEIKFFNMENWAICGRKTYDEEELHDLPCYIGVDLASKDDICAVVACFFRENGEVLVLPKLFCPEDKLKNERKDGVSYTNWAENGNLILTSGCRIDYNIVKQEIEALWGKYEVRLMGFDQWQFEYLRQRLVSDGMDEERLIQYPQNLRNMSEPTKELAVLVDSHQLVHNNHPVMRWFAENTAVFVDPNENIRPVKNRSAEKIDGIVALIMALGLRMAELPKIDNERNLLEVGI